MLYFKIKNLVIKNNIKEYNTNNNNNEILLNEVMKIQNILIHLN